MNAIIINLEELSALSGLPHLQQLLYLRGIRPYVDYQTSLVGIKRGVSYQSFAETLYIEPHPGIKGGSPSKDQLRRALKGLERAGLLEIQSLERKLVFKCLLVKEDYSGLNKLAIKSHHKEARSRPAYNSESSKGNTNELQNGALENNEKAATPLIKDNNYIFLLQQFEKFWDLYPLKKSKHKAWEAFQVLNPANDLLMQIHSALQQQIQLYQQQQTQGQWVAAWKYPANWLAQQCWEDEIQYDTHQEKNHAVNKTRFKKESDRDNFWDSCKSGIEEETDDNIIELSAYRGTSKTD